jgi:alanine dehydrogenase
VTILERSLPRIRELERQFGSAMRVLVSEPLILEEALEATDVLIGAVLVPGARAPHLITGDHVGRMSNGAVIVDVAIDQGGCVETALPTTHADPVYDVDGVLHYCVANIPGAVPVTATRALTNATIGYVRRLASDPDWALAQDPGFARGLNIRAGEIMSAPVAAAFEQRDPSPHDRSSLQRRPGPLAPGTGQSSRTVHRARGAEGDARLRALLSPLGPEAGLICRADSRAEAFRSV